METSNVVVSVGTLNTQFEAAAEEAASLEVSNESKLELYALYKQATVGDCSSEEPSMLNVVGNLKWRSWKRLAGTTESDAKAQYISLVRKLDPASEVEAKEDEEEEDAEDEEDVDAEEDLEEKVVAIEQTVTHVEKRSEPKRTVTYVHMSTANLSFPTSQLASLGVLPTQSESPLPTWGVFLLGVLFLCFLDDNLSLSNILMNSMGVSFLTAAIISLQLR